MARDVRYSSLAVQLAVVLSLLVVSPAASAFNSSAWTRPQKEVWSLVSFGYVAARTQFLPDRSEADFVNGISNRDTFEDASFYAQLQLGLLDALTLNTTIPYKRVFVEQEAFLTETQAIGDIYLGLRLGLFEAQKLNLPVAWSLEVGVSLPTGYTRNLAPSVGPGNVDIELKTTVGYGFRPIDWLPMYGQAGFGLKIRTGVFSLSNATDCNLTSDVDCVIDSRPNYSDELIYLVELGTTPLSGSVLLFSKLFGAHSVLEPDVGFTAANPIPERQRYVKAGFGMALYPLKLVDYLGWGKVESLAPLGLMFQHFWTVDGQNTPNTRDLFAGLEMTYRL